MTKEDVFYEIDEVEAGSMSLDDCIYPDEVEDELGSDNFDSYGNYRIPTSNWENVDNNTEEKETQPIKNNEGICGGLLLIIVIFFIITSLL